MIDTTVTAALAGERLDRIVALIAGCSRAEAAALIASGAVVVDGSPAMKPSLRLREGASLAMPDGPSDTSVAVATPDPTVAVDLVHEDGDVLVIDKPPGLVVHPGAGHASGTLVNGLLARFPEIASIGDPERPGIVHRLDKDTSGLLVVARSERAFESLRVQASSHTMTRRYVALVWGEPDAPEGLIDAPVGRSTRAPSRMAVSTAGREARTQYEVVTVFDARDSGGGAAPTPQRPRLPGGRSAAGADAPLVSLLRLTLETGRTHQIRVHLAAIGHPVVGDDRYGGRRAPFTETELPRFFLHAELLAFEHPATGESVTFESRLPNDLVELLARVREGSIG